MFPLSHMLRRFVQSGCLYVFDPDGKRHVRYSTLTTP